MTKDNISNEQADMREDVNDEAKDELKDTSNDELESAEDNVSEGLKEQLDKKEAELTEYLDTLKRVQAEMENFRKRMIKEQEQIIQYAAQTVILELLPVIDNLERALDTARADSEGGKLFEGVELIHSQLLRILEKECVETIDPRGEEFDPMKHEAVMQIDSPDHKENTVVEVMQKGYDLKGRLLRPAMVVVAR